MTRNFPSPRSSSATTAPRGSPPGSFRRDARVGYGIAAHEQRVAVPAVTVGNVRLHQKPHSGFMPDRQRIEEAAAAAETPVDFL